MVALLDASASDFVRGRHCLSSREDFPRVYKIVEGQEKLHVKNAVKELCSKGCKVIACSTGYYANGIAMRDSVRTRLDDWSVPNNRARPGSYQLDAIARAIRDFVVAQNLTMTRVLHELGFHHLKGEKRHIYAESAGNVTFRRTYIQKKLANRVAVRGPMKGSKRSVRLGVKRPEVYLDESYRNVEHVTGKTWLTADKIRYGKTGRGAR
ncbi:hypothetical protein PF001_g17411 [Phytophthora fragariae]|uniref:Uncharacterized protein n=1 Tax=Phytophthora fragariae TaxID=53985 RepID=A0A6A4D1E8_9STRA|nr:hypothetical protein PF001_g17411 [Phytophthora fragariae]